MAFLLDDEPADDPSVGAESAHPYEDLRVRLEERRASKDASDAGMELSRPEIALVESALLYAQLYEITDSRLRDLEAKDRALHDLYKREGPKAVAKALGLSRGKRGDSYPHDDVRDDYVWLIGREPRVGARCILTPARSDGSTLYPSPPVTRLEAIRLLKHVYGFPSKSACRDSLLKSRRRLRTLYGRRPGPPGSPVHDFPIPDLSQLR